MAAGGKCPQCDTYGSTSHCSVCDTFHCAYCVANHLEIPDIEYECTSIIIECEEHKHFFDSPCLHYCKLCKTAVCVFCIVEAHKDHVHQLLTMEKVWYTKKSEIEALRREMWSNNSDRLLANVKNKWLEKVNKTITYAKEETRKHKQKMKERLETLNNAKCNIQTKLEDEKTLDFKDFIPLWKSKKECRILSVDDHVKNVFSTAISTLKDELDEVFRATFSKCYGNCAPESVRDIDIDVESLWDITCDRQKRIFCSAKNASTLYIMHENQKPKTNIRTNETPEYIAISRKSDFIYFTSANQILTMPLDETGLDTSEPTEFYRAEDMWELCGLTVTSSSNVLLCLSTEKEGKVLEIAKDGNVIDEYQHEHATKANPFFTKPLYVAENNANFNICVSDFEKVLSITKEKTVHFIYKGTADAQLNSLEPRGIDFDSNGYLYISDFANKCVHRLDKDGKFLNMIAKGKLFKPTGLCLDHEDRILVTEFENRRIKIIEMK